MHVPSLTPEQARTVAENIGLAHEWLRQYQPRGYSFDEARSVAYLGLCRAVATWNPSRAALSTWAFTIIDCAFYNDRRAQKPTSKQRRPPGGWLLYLEELPPIPDPAQTEALDIVTAIVAFQQYVQSRKPIAQSRILSIIPEALRQDMNVSACARTYGISREGARQRLLKAQRECWRLKPAFCADRKED